MKRVTPLAVLLPKQILMAKAIAEDKGGEIGHTGADCLSRNDGSVGFSRRNCGR